MTKLYRKYRTRDLLMLERRGVSAASNELDRRTIADAQRASTKRLRTAEPEADPFEAQARDMREALRRARYMPLPATISAEASTAAAARTKSLLRASGLARRKSPSEIRRDARRAEAVQS